MDRVLIGYLDAPLFSFVHFLLFVGYVGIFSIIILSVIKVLDYAFTLKKVFLLSAFLSILAVVLRKYVPGPYTMLLFYVIIMLIIAFFFKVPLIKCFVGVIFALVLSMLSIVLISQNILTFTEFDDVAEENIYILVSVGLTEVFFNLVYVILASRFKNLNLSFMFFNEEKNAKA